jgi:hypothetical protein
MQPLIRLALSRSRLSLALHHVHAEQGRSSAPREAAHPVWWEALCTEPGTRVVLDALSAWWAQQPWHQTTALLAESAKRLLRPLAQRNPVALVLGAAAIGGAVVLLKPWRWISVPALTAGVMPGLIAGVFSQLRPLSWAELLNSWLKTLDKNGPAP